MSSSKRLCNPLLPPDIHFADPEAHVIDGSLYIYGSCDVSTEHYCSGKYYVVHSDDYETFHISPVSFEADDVSWGSEARVHSSLSDIHSFEDLPEHIKAQLPEEARFTPVEDIIQAIESYSRQGLPKEKLLYAPDALKIGEHNALFFCMSDDSEGVAFADSMKGRFRDPVRIKIEDGDYIDGIDPAIFVDDDGKIYYYWGQFNAMAGELNENLVEINKQSYIEDIINEEEHYFHEGSSMRKRGDKYYYVYASVARDKPTCLAYSVGDSPLGPFSYRGVVVDNNGSDPEVWNNHGSIECIDDQWYVFYHRSSCHSSSMRQICVEPIRFDEDGNILESKMTSQGMGEPFGINEFIPAYSACWISDDGYTQDEFLLVPLGSSNVIYRYISLAENAREIIIKAEGEARVDVIFRRVESIEEDRFMKSVEVLSAKRNNREKEVKDSLIYIPTADVADETVIDCDIQSGEYELILSIREAKDFKMLGIRIGG